MDAANAGMRKQSSAKVHVTVADVNDNSPLFKEGQKQTVYFNENEPAGARWVQNFGSRGEEFIQKVSMSTNFYIVLGDPGSLRHGLG